MQAYVCGFLFCTSKERVLLIRKRRPDWQVGKLNGVGGKIESGESPLDAMKREFAEEAGLEITEWQEVLEVTGDEWRGHFFRTFGEIDAARAMTDEQLEIHTVRLLPSDTIPNLRWMIPMLLDDDLASRKYAIRVTA